MKENRRFTTDWGKRKMLLHIASLFPPEGLPEALFRQTLPPELQLTVRKMLKEHYLIRENGKIRRSPLIEAPAQPPAWNAVFPFAERVFQLLQRVVCGEIDESQASALYTAVENQRGREDSGTPNATVLPVDQSNRPDGNSCVAENSKPSLEEMQQRIRFFHEKTDGALCVLVKNLLQCKDADPWITECAADFLASYYHACQMYESGIACTLFEIEKMETRKADLSEMISAHQVLLFIASEATPDGTETLEKYLFRYQEQRKKEEKSESSVT